MALLDFLWCFAWCLRAFSVYLVSMLILSEVSPYSGNSHWSKSKAGAINNCSSDFNCDDWCMDTVISRPPGEVQKGNSRRSESETSHSPKADSWLLTNYSISVLSLFTNLHLSDLTLTPSMMRAPRLIEASSRMFEVIIYWPSKNWSPAW